MQYSFGFRQAIIGLFMTAVVRPAQTGTPADLPAPTPLDPVTITATRIVQPARNAPGALSVIGVERLMGQGHATLVNALRLLPGIQVRSTSGNAAQAEIDLRGFGEGSHGRVLVLHDGRQLNNPDMAGIPWLQIPLGQTERVEVLRGGQSVLYGNHALAGVINIASRDIGLESRTDLAAMAGSDGKLAVRAETEGATGANRFQAGAEHHQTDGYRERSGFDAWNLHGQIRRLSEDGAREAGLRASWNRLDYEMPGGLSLAEWKADPRQSVNPADEARVDDLSLRADLAAHPGELPGAQVGLTYGRRALETDFGSWNSYADTDIDRIAVTPRLHGTHSLLRRDSQWIAGLDASWDRLEATRYNDGSRRQETVSATIERWTAGLYALHDLALDDAWSIRIGGRLEQARYDALVKSPDGTRPVDTDTTHRVNAAEAGLRFEPAEQVRLFARATTLYRYPFVDEQVNYAGFGTDGFYDALDAERGISAEIGADGSLNGHFTWEVNAFRLVMRDEIAYNPATGINDNMADTQRDGIETALTWQHASLGIMTAHYDFTRARFTDGPHDGQDVPLVPQHRLGVTVGFRLPADMTALARLKYVDRQWLGGDYDNAQPRLDAYTTLDIGLRARPTAVPGLELFAGLDNVLDESHAEIGYVGFIDNAYYPAPGRTWKAAASLRF